MNKFETIAIIKPEFDEKEVNGILERYKKIIIDNGGKINEYEYLGKKRLAYEIKGNEYGNYINIMFESENQFVEELERKYKQDEDILKFIVVKREY